MDRQALMREWGKWFAGVDLVLTPTWTQPPFEHGWDAESAENAMATLEMMRCVTPANVLGLPSAAVPAGLVDGVPVGVLGPPTASPTTSPSTPPRSSRRRSVSTRPSIRSPHDRPEWGRVTDAPDMKSA